MTAVPLLATDVSQNFHVYQLVWSAGSWYLRSMEHPRTGNNRSYVPSGPIYMKINNFVGNIGRAVDHNFLGHPWSIM